MLTYNQNFVPNGTWLQANSILTGRLARISVDFYLLTVLPKAGLRRGPASTPNSQLPTSVFLYDSR